MSEKSKKIKKLEEKIGEMKNELTFLRSSFNDINRRIDLVNERQDRMGTIFDWHAHPDTKLTGRAVFMQEHYETFVREQAEQGVTVPGQIPPPSPPPGSPPVEEEDEDEEE